MKSKPIDDDYFVRNAIYCWLHYYPRHQWVDKYRELLKRESFNPKDAVVKARPARRRKPKPKPEDNVGAI